MNLYSHNMVRILQYTYYMHGSLYLNVSQKCLGFCTPQKKKHYKAGTQSVKYKVVHRIQKSSITTKNVTKIK
jgi:hypothetical protein